MNFVPLPKHQTKSGGWAERICTGTKSGASAGGRCRTSQLRPRKLPLRDLDDTRETSSLTGSGCGCKEKV